MRPGLFPQQKQNSGMQHAESSMKTVYFKNQTLVSLMFTCMCPVFHKIMLLSLYFRENCNGISLLLIFHRCQAKELSWSGDVGAGLTVSFPRISGIGGLLCREKDQSWQGPALAGHCLVPCPWENSEKGLCSDRHSREGISTKKCHSLKGSSTEGSCFPPSEHYATVALTFQDMAAQSELELECKGVPVAHEESTRQCWKKQYFEEIHILLQQSKDNMEW